MTWKRWTPSESEPWDLKRVVHLHRRAGFGSSWEQIKADLKAGHEATIDRVLNGTRATDEDAQIASVGQAAVGSNNPERLKAWWILRMLVSRHPLREKLTLMWHNHFATSNQKVQNLEAMKRQNETLYSLGYGDFGTLLHAMAHDPAILIWLDASGNRKGRPNENLAREIMELFSLGVGHYSETDVREAARALTGWAVNEKHQFTFNTDNHDNGTKTILGQTGPWNGNDLIRILLEQPAVAERTAWRLCATFMGESQVSATDLQALASDLRRQKLNIRAATELILRSENFFSDDNIGNRVSDPIEFILAATQAAEIQNPLPGTLKLARWTAALGQDLFYPPNVGGWTGGRNWLSTRYIVARANFAATLCDGGLHNSFQIPDLAAFVAEQDQSPVAQIISHFNNVLLGNRLAEATCHQIEATVHAQPVSPAEQLQYAVALLLALPEFQEC